MMRIVAFFCAMLFATTTAALSASITFDIIEDVGGLTVKGAGAIDLAGLDPPGSASTAPVLNGGLPALVVGPTAAQLASTFVGAFSALPTFGMGFDVSSTGSGDRFGFSVLGGVPTLVLPQGYQSGDPLLGESFFPGSTFASLGLTAGSFTLTLVNDETIDVRIGVVPLPAAVLLLAPALAALALAGRVRV